MKCAGGLINSSGTALNSSDNKDDPDPPKKIIQVYESRHLKIRLWMELHGRRDLSVFNCSWMSARAAWIWLIFKVLDLTAKDQNVLFQLVVYAHGCPTSIKIHGASICSRDQEFS